MFNWPRTDADAVEAPDGYTADRAAVAGVTDLQSTRAGAAAAVVSGVGKAAVNSMAGSNRKIGGPTRPDNRARPIELPPPAVTCGGETPRRCTGRGRQRMPGMMRAATY